MSPNINSLSDKHKRQVYGECLACLGYFAFNSGLCKRSDLQRALAHGTRLAETKDYQGRYNWWNSKLANIQFAFNSNALNGAEIYGRRLKSKRGKGRSSNLGTQQRIKDFSLWYFLNDLEKCRDFARMYLSVGVTFDVGIEAALFRFKSDNGVGFAELNDSSAGTIEPNDSRISEPQESGGNWIESELCASVDAYFKIQRRVSSGEKFVMKSALQDVTTKSLPRRNRGSVERRMANISAVLIELGLPWCHRFKPLRNVGAKVKKVIAARIRALTADEGGLAAGGIVKDDVPDGQGYGSKENTEGARRLASHYVIERSAAAAEEAKELNRVLNDGEYCCEVCGDKPGVRYGVRVIDAHHIRPLSESDGEYLVRAQDFLIVCPNCHRAIHRLEDFSGEALIKRLRKA